MSTPTLIEGRGGAWKLSEPFEISPRLLPALRVRGAWIQLELAERPGREGRLRWRWTLDLPDGSEYSDDDLQSGCGESYDGKALQGAFASLLSFLGACAESRRYSRGTGREGENADLFPDAVGEWAESCSDELSMLAFELEEGSDR